MTEPFHIQMESARLLEMSSLALAHVGDAVYELLVRTRLSQQSLTANEMHKKTVYFVCAPSQAVAAREILPLLDETEAGVFRRARNAKAHHAIPQAASQAEYALATALEALFGSLYLTNRQDRIAQLFELCWVSIQNRPAAGG